MNEKITTDFVQGEFRMSVCVVSNQQTQTNKMRINNSRSKYNKKKIGYMISYMAGKLS